jgi:hypothetical protein
VVLRGVTEYDLMVGTRLLHLCGLLTLALTPQYPC